MKSGRFTHQKKQNRDIMIHNECCKDDTNQQRLDSFFVKKGK